VITAGAAFLLGLSVALPHQLDLATYKTGSHAGPECAEYKITRQVFVALRYVLRSGAFVEAERALFRFLAEPKAYYCGYSAPSGGLFGNAVARGEDNVGGQSNSDEGKNHPAPEALIS